MDCNYRQSSLADYQCHRRGKCLPPRRHLFGYAVRVLQIGQTGDPGSDRGTHIQNHFLSCTSGLCHHKPSICSSGWGNSCRHCDPGHSLVGTGLQQPQLLLWHLRKCYVSLVCDGTFELRRSDRPETMLRLQQGQQQQQSPSLYQQTRWCLLLQLS